jgi:nifR3 family TIM-barrel protein
LLRGTATSLDLAKTDEFDKPIGMQLYGSDPEIMAQGARWAVEHGASVVDINMGCPVDKVTKKDGGSKLLTDLTRAVAIARRVREELEKCPVERSDSPHSLVRSFAPVPLTCKMRLCWSLEDYRAGEACSPLLARMLADVGVAAVTVHGRTTEDKFAGHVRLEGISRVVESVAGAIPIIGNGDVRTPTDAERMLRETGCDGVMIGRGALSTPWIFRDCWASLSGVPVPHPPSEHEILVMIRRYVDMMESQRDARYALFQVQRRISWFARHLQRPFTNGKLESVKPFKEMVRTATSTAVVREALERFGAGELRGGVEIELAGAG